MLFEVSACPNLYLRDWFTRKERKEGERKVLLYRHYVDSGYTSQAWILFILVWYYPQWPKAYPEWTCSLALPKRPRANGNSNSLYNHLIFFPVLAHMGLCLHTIPTSNKGTYILDSFIWSPSSSLHLRSTCLTWTRYPSLVLGPTNFVQHFRKLPFKLAHRKPHFELTLCRKLPIRICRILHKLHLELASRSLG